MPIPIILGALAASSATRSDAGNTTFLNRLSEEQKDLFLDLCIHAAMANDDFDYTEKSLINQYCDEMKIAEPRYTPKRSFEEICNRLSEICSKPDVRIIVIETAALMLSDNEYDESERRFMRVLIRKLGLSNDDYNDIMDYIKKITKLYSEMNKFIIKK